MPVVELQRRPRTKTGSGMRRDAEAALGSNPSPKTLQPRKSTQALQPGTTAVVSRNICFDLKNVSTPDEFDPASTVLACGFPSGCSIMHGRQFLSWIGPVIRVDRAPSIGNEANFIAVFASDEYAHLATRQPLPFDDKGTAIVCRLVDRKPDFWDSWMPSWKGTSSSPTPMPVMGTPMTPNGPSTVDSIVSGWSSLMNSDGVRNIGSNLSHIGQQVASHAQTGYTQATQKMGA